MFVVDLVQWWYTKGWGVYFAEMKRKLSDAVDFFSFSDLVRTLFKPYRQISASASGEALESKASALLDRLISRIVGLFARLTIIIFGGILVTVEAVGMLLLAIIWPAVPLMPIIGILLTIMGTAL